MNSWQDDRNAVPDSRRANCTTTGANAGDDPRLRVQTTEKGEVLRVSEVWHGEMWVEWGVVEVCGIGCHSSQNDGDEIRGATVHDVPSAIDRIVQSGNLND